MIAIKLNIFISRQIHNKNHLVEDINTKKLIMYVNIVGGGYLEQNILYQKKSLKQD